MAAIFLEKFVRLCPLHYSHERYVLTEAVYLTVFTSNVLGLQGRAEDSASSSNNRRQHYRSAYKEIRGCLPYLVEFLNSTF